MKVSIVGYKTLPLDKLTPHPAAEKFPRGGEDQQSLNVSLGDEGMLQPLSVLATPAKDGCYQVVDGCTRLEAALAKVRAENAEGAKEIPCLLMEVDDVDSYVLQVNTCRRRVSTGCRILAYLTLHKREVFAAAAINYDHKATGAIGGKIGGRGKKAVSQEQPFMEGDQSMWSCAAIADRLLVCREDVACALELLRCKELRLCPLLYMDGIFKPERALDKKVEGDAALADDIAKQYLAVLGGQSPVRRWKAAIAGRLSTAGQKRKTIDHADLAHRSMISLRTALPHWGEIDSELRGVLADDWQKLLKVLPAHLITLTLNHAKETRK